MPSARWKGRSPPRRKAASRARSHRSRFRPRAGDTVIDSDEQPRKARPDKIPHLKPAFRKDGTMTPANASSISDGAAALMLMRRARGRKRQGLNVRARILGHASHAQAPGWFTTAPISAINKLMERIGWNVDDVDLWEINEAFAVVPMAAEARTGHSARQVERPWRRLRARPSDRRLGRAHPGNAAQRAGDPWPQTRHGRHLHRRRRGDGGGDRACVI